ncbi:hypothetical protein F2P56_030595 [Juglans regia]|uniref:Uncharacterized protein n=1 Tax=Juglans regia TaxID=51240 RepID=A0A833U443_JUGRE|nr:hypothetical protein F2P56_030595 [Juglans regia]
MSFGNAAHHHDHHGKQYRHWDTSDSYQQYQVSESTEVMPERRITVTNLYPGVYDQNYNIKGYEERVVVDQALERVQVTEYELAPQQPLKPSRHHHVDSENVDKEAEEFIRAEHRLFWLSKMMSRTDGRPRPCK